MEHFEQIKTALMEHFFYNILYNSFIFSIFAVQIKD